MVFQIVAKFYLSRKGDQKHVGFRQNLNSRLRVSDSKILILDSGFWISDAGLGFQFLASRFQIPHQMGELGTGLLYQRIGP